MGTPLNSEQRTPISPRCTLANTKLPPKTDSEATPTKCGRLSTAFVMPPSLDSKTENYTRCTYSQCMPRAHLYDLWTNTCGLVGVAHAFEIGSGTVGYACATKCEKCEKEGKAYPLGWKSSRMRARFRTAQNAKIWSFLKMARRFICFAWRLLLSRTRRSRRGLHGLEAAFTLSSPPFSRQAPSFFFLASITTLTSSQWDH